MFAQSQALRVSSSLLASNMHITYRPGLQRLPTLLPCAFVPAHARMLRNRLALPYSLLHKYIEQLAAALQSIERIEHIEHSARRAAAAHPAGAISSRASRPPKSAAAAALVAPAEEDRVHVHGGSIR